MSTLVKEAPRGCRNFRHNDYADTNLPNGQLQERLLRDRLSAYAVTQTIPTFPDSLQTAFLARVLETETFTQSNPKSVIEHPAYNELKKIGRAALSVIFCRIDYSPTTWLTVLPDLTGETAVRADHRGTTRLMLEDWKSWARERGFLD